MYSGISDTGGGRWGAQKRHAVVAGTTRQTSRLGGKRAQFACGVYGYPFDGPIPSMFDPADQHACKRCVNITKGATHA